MVLCELRRESPGNFLFHQYTHTNRLLSRRGPLSRSRADKQRRNIHRFYIDKYPDDDHTIRDCVLHPPHLRRRNATRRTPLAAPFRRTRRQRVLGG